jgi:SIR2-like domain
VRPEHDPLLQASFLRQCLSHDKRPLGVLLGAGCPMAIRVKRGGADEPLIPDIAGMTKRVASALSATPSKDPYALVCSHFKKDALPEPNVEHLLSHIRSLRQVAGKDSVRGLSAKELDDLDGAICAELAESCNCNLPDSATPYHILASWVGATERVAPVEIFTTNYDLLMEEALEANRVPYFDGFVGSHETFLDLQSMEDDRLPARWSRLWKIHGSLNWYEDGRGSIRRGPNASARCVIYPSHLKYDESRRMPYLAMIDRLRAFLKKEAGVLVTSGFSFSDKHLNEIIIQGLQGNPTSVVFALLYGKLRDYPQLEKLAQNRSNLTAMASDSGFIGTKRVDWPTERDARSVADSTAVEWLDNAAKPGRKDAQFTLGSFGSFATFLDDIIGQQNRAARP